MPQLASITLTDGKSTPASHVFAPVTTNGSQARLANRSAIIPQGFETLELVVRDPGKNKQAAYTIAGSLTLPTVATVDSLDKVVRSSKFEFTMRLSQESTLQDRKDILALAASLFGNATMKSVVEQIEPLY